MVDMNKGVYGQEYNVSLFIHVSHAFLFFKVSHQFFHKVWRMSETYLLNEDLNNILL